MPDKNKSNSSLQSIDSLKDTTSDINSGHNSANSGYSTSSSSLITTTSSSEVLEQLIHFLEEKNY
ncbi:unnamed protein product [Medioppia subpectinata]|uniref:Uncharacterized protein n=1 Tax=Medioppia subpectinata TaxID=1979941 RepID=A0A7R9KDY2_9ACAR|nr:unnamed protein product [Medioppia subpectinata]CAG2101596.1 unnamed protein product [Medioppia subpectinata]